MFDRFIQIKDEGPKYLSGKGKKKEAKKVPTYQGGLQ